MEPKEFWSLDKLKLWKDNPRIVSKENFERLKRQIQELGEYKPLIITPDGTVLGGNMRLRAYRELGYKEAWVSVVEAKTEKEKLKYALSDNDQVGEYQRDDLANLIGNLPDISLGDYSVNLGKSTPISDLLPQEIEEDEAPEVAEGEPVSRLGEVYQLGKHRLMCGDSTKIEDVEKLMNGQKADMVFTSPPYNMGADMYENYEDNLKSQEYIDFNLEVVHTWLPFLKGYLFWNISYNKNSRWEFLEIMYRLVKETGLRFLEMIVWDKGHALPITSADMLTRQYEDVLFVGDEESVSRDMELFYMGTKYKRAFFNKKTNKGITNYWKIDTNKTQLENHLACFPVKLPAKAINLVTQPNEIVVDMFGGSGSTLIACEQTDRTCYMMELDPKYCDVIRKRYANFIGKEEQWQKITPTV